MYVGCRGQSIDCVTQFGNLWLLCVTIEKTHSVVSEQVLHKPSGTVSEDGLKLEIMDLESRGTVLSV